MASVFFGARKTLFLIFELKTDNVIISLIMSVLHSIILGLIQGLTEFFPISSSAHLTVAPWLFTWEYYPVIFIITVHVATFCAVIIYFRKEWADILREGLLSIRERNLKGPGQRRLFWGIVIASIPGVIFGSIVGGRVEYYFRDPMLVAITLGMFGIILYLAELYSKKNKSLEDITWQISLLVGLAQMLAVIPGVSRSGITITMALALGMNRESSVRFSLLLSAPIIFAAACYSLGGLAQISKPFLWQVFLAGFIASFLSSIIAIHFLLGYVRRHPFVVFVVYRLALSLIIITVLFWRT